MLNSNTSTGERNEPGTPRFSGEGTERSNDHRKPCSLGTSTSIAVLLTILATLTTPKNATGPVPVVLMFSGGGAAPQGVPTTTSCVVPGGPAPRGATPAQPAAAAAGAARGAAPNAAAGAGRGAGPGGGNQPPSAQEQILSHGWGYANVSTASIQADNGQGLTCGIIGLVNKGQPRSLDDW